jgi:hypothetical protein
MLGNFFEPSEGKKNERFVRRHVGNLGEVIEHEKEAWEQMIGEIETLLGNIVSLIKTGPKS